MPHETQPTNDISAAQKLNQDLADMGRQNRQALRDERSAEVFPDVMAEEQDRGIFGNAMRTSLGVAGKALSPLFKGLALPGDLGSYWGYKHIWGGKTSARDRRVRRQMDRVGNSGSWFSNVMERQEIQQNRHSSWLGEKLLTSIITDPLTLTGFGIYARAPGIAGKLLGAADRAFIGATNATFQGALKVTSRTLGMPISALAQMSTYKLQKLVDNQEIDPNIATYIKGTFFGSPSLSVKTSEIRDEVSSAFGAWLDRSSGLPARNYVDDASITAKALKELMEMTRDQLSKADDGARATRDAIDHVFITRSSYAKDDWAKAFTDQGGKLDSAKQSEINDVVNNYMTSILSFEDARDRLMTVVHNNPMSGELAASAGEFLIRARMGRKKFVEELSAQGPVQAIHSLSQKVSHDTTLQIQSGIELLRTQQAFVGGLLNGIDKTYTTIWRKGIEKYLMRPFAEAVLAFPTYPLGNMIEDIYFMVNGGSIPRNLLGGGDSVKKFNQVFQGVNIPGLERMRREGREGLSDIAGALGERQRGEFTLVPTKLAGINVTALGRFWMDASNKISGGLRRQYFTKRQEANLRQHLNDLRDRDPSVKAILDRLLKSPNTNVGELSDGLVQQATLLVAKGDSVGLRQLIRQYTGPEIMRADMQEHVRMLSPDDFHGSSKDILLKGIDTGDYDYLVNTVVDQAIENERKILSNSVESYSDWFDNVIKTFSDHPLDPATASKDDLFAVMSQFEDAMHRANNILHDNMAATFGKIGKKFGKAEKDAMDEAYQKTEALLELIRTKGGIITNEYRRAAQNFGISAEESAAQFTSIMDVINKRWQQDILEHEQHFAKGGNALDWRLRRNEIWQPYTDDIEMAMVQAQRALVSDVLGLEMKGTTDEWMDKIATTPLAAALKRPVITEEEWFRKSAPLAQLKIDFAKKAKQSRLSAGEEANIKAWINDIADLIDTKAGAQADAARLAEMKPVTLGRYQHPEQVAAGSKRGMPGYTAIKQGDEVIGYIVDEAKVSASARSYARKHGMEVTPKPEKEGFRIWGLKEGRVVDISETALATAGRYPPAIGRRLDIDMPAVFSSLADAGSAALKAITESAKTSTSLDEVVRLRGVLRKAWDDSLNATQRDSKQAFTNYNDQDSLDFVMKHIFPFWTYAKNIWPRLMANGVAHPAAHRVGSPDGAYWNETDGGYLPMNVFGTQIAPYRGLGVGRIKNAFKQDYEARNVGIYGEVEKNVDAMERYGFYPGFPWTLTGASLASLRTDSDFTPGEQLPPMMDAVVNVALLTGALTGTEETSSLNEALKLGRFRESQERKIAFSMGYDPVNLTPEQERDIIKRASSFSIVNAALSLLRYRPDKYVEYREKHAEALALISGVSVEEQERLREEGINLFDHRPLSPYERRDLRSLMGEAFMGDIVKDYGTINTPFQSEEEQRISEGKARLFDYYDQVKEMGLFEQFEDDDEMKSGRMSASRWRSERKLRNRTKRASWEAAQAMAGITDEDMERTVKHQQDELQEVFWSVDADSPEYIDPLTGYTLWDKVLAEQNVRASAYIESVGGNKDLMLKEFQDYQLEGRTPLDQEYLIGIQQGNMDWFNIRKALRWYAGDNAGLLQSLQGMERDSAAAEQGQRRAIAGGEPRILANLIGRTPGERVMKGIVLDYRRHLLATNPDIETWLRRFYEIIPT